MRHTITKTLAALVATVALTAVATATASAALPEFSFKATETYPAGIEAKVHEGTATFESKAFQWGYCDENGAEGLINGYKTLSLTLVWRDCRNVSHGYVFTSEGAPEGTIIIPGTGTLVYIDKATKEVGIALTLKETKINYASDQIKVKGTIIIPVTPINTATTSFAFPIHEITFGEQEIRSYENEKGEAVSAHPEMNFETGWKQAGFEISGTNPITTTKTVTIKG